MPKTLLTGTLEEQCTFLFDLAQEKMAAGNHTGAAHALKEILKHSPDFPGAQELLVEVKTAKRAQGTIVWFSIGGAVVAVFVGTLVGLPNDLWLLALAAVGWVGAYLVASQFVGRGTRHIAAGPATSAPERPPHPQRSSEPTDEPGAH